MKTTLKLLAIASVAFLILQPAYAQESKKYKLYIETEENGKSIKIDTSFTSKEDMEAFMVEKGFGISELPKIADIQSLSELPEIPDLSELENIVIDLDGLKLSEADQAKIRDEMDKARKEMKKARIELKGSQEDMEKVKKEMEKVKKEMKNLNIEIEKEGENGQRIIIKKSADESNAAGGEKRMMFIRTDDEDATPGKVKVIRMKCDSLKGEDHAVRIIRKINHDEKSNGEEAIRWIMKEEEPVAEVAEVAEVTAPSNQGENTTNDYRLRVDDFKAYPNPTHGKVDVSFRIETPGLVTLRMLDGAGRTVIEDEVQVTDGIFHKTYNLEGNSRGTYLLQIKQGNMWKHEKVVLK